MVCQKGTPLGTVTSFGGRRPHTKLSGLLAIWPKVAQYAAYVNLTASLSRLLSARMRALIVRPMFLKNGVANSGAFFESSSKAVAEIFNRMLSRFATTSAARGPWSKRE